jgi:hypothetical protein
MLHLDVTDDDIAPQLEEVHLFHIGQDPTKSSPPITVTLQIDSVPVPFKVGTGAELGTSHVASQGHSSFSSY